MIWLGGDIGENNIEELFLVDYISSSSNWMGQRSTPE